MTNIRPRFDKPPLVEQAITIMFDPIPGFTLGDVGLFWKALGNDFPICESHPHLNQIVEAFEQQPSFRLQFGTEAHVPRALYRRADGSELVQVQGDRFSFNWMRTDTSSYPKHEATIERFWELFGLFCSFLGGRGLSVPVPTQCELTNVNIIPHGEFGNSLAEAISTVQFAPPKLDLPGSSLEGVQANATYVLSNASNQPVGRLYALVQSVIDLAKGQGALRFDLTARGAPTRPEREGVTEFFGIARSAINSIFVAYTSEDARRSWGER